MGDQHKITTATRKQNYKQSNHPKGKEKKCARDL